MRCDKMTSGAVLAILVQILPSAIAMIFLMSVVHILSSSPIIAGMIAAVTPVIAVMLGMMAYEFIKRSMKGLGKWLGFVFFIISFVLLQIIHIHPGFVVALFLAYGAFHYKTLKFVDLALGNTLPGPISTKMGAYAGYYIYGWTGMFIALGATVIPSAVAVIILLKILQKHRQSLVVKGMTLLVQPVIAIMMIVLTWHMAATSVHAINIWQSLGIAAAAFWAIGWRKIHPAIVISAAFIYGGLILS